MKRVEWIPGTRIYIGMASRMGRAPIATLTGITKYAMAKGYEPIFVVMEATTIVHARNAIVDVMRQVARAEKPEATHAYMLWLDDDLLMMGRESGRPIDMYLHALRHGGWWTGSYTMITGESALIKERPEKLSGGRKPAHFTRDEITKMQTGDPIGMAGFGLLAGPQLLDYQFYASGGGKGEDINYWADTEERIRFYPAGAYHLKQVRIPSGLESPE